MRVLLILSLSLLFAHEALAQQVYKWKDAEGRTHYSNSPPPSSSQAEVVKDRLATVSGSNGSAQVSGGQRVVMFTTQSCGVCKMAKSYLTRKGVPYTERDIEVSDSAAADFKRLGGRGVPLILVGSEVMRGFSEQGMDNLLEQAGYTPKL